jgi:MFS family permease
MEAVAHDARSWHRAVGAVFAVHGAVAGSFAARIPWIQDHLGLGAGALGVALLAPAIGAVFSMPLSARVVHRLGSRRATRLLLPLWAASLALPALAPSLPALFAALLVFGVASGTSDVAMNAQGVELEAWLGRSIMSGLHGMWSIGGLLGSAIGVLAARAGVDARIELSAIAALLVVSALVAGRGLVEVPRAVRGDEPPWLAWPSRAVLLIGVVGFCAIFAEGSSADWCAVYVRTVSGADAAVAASAYAAFAFAMAGGRLAGDAVVNRLGPVRTVRLAGSVATLGGALVVVATHAGVAIVAFGLVGLGVSVVVPLAFAAAGRAEARPGHAIAAVATIAYGAGLAAPGIVGGVAHLTSLRWSFALVTAAAAVIALGAGALHVRRPVPLPAWAHAEMDG